MTFFLHTAKLESEWGKTLVGGEGKFEMKRVGKHVIVDGDWRDKKEWIYRLVLNNKITKEIFTKI